jgi:hypothetical protein
MRMRNLAAALAAGLALTGCSAAAADASRSAPADGSTNIMVYSINSDGPDMRAIVSGAIGDYGPAVTVLPDGTVDPSHTHDMKLTLAKGSFLLNIAALDKKFVAVASHEPIYPATCSDHIAATGAVPIVAGSGTGAYKGVRGGFRLTITVDEVEKRPCRPAAAFQTQLLTLTGAGTVSLG